MQQNPFAAPPPSSTRLTPVGTPLLHVAAGAGAWYAVTIAAYVGHALKNGAWDLVQAAAVVGGILFVMTTVVTWLFLLKRRLKPWTLIPFTVPVYIAVAIALSTITGAARGVYVFMLNQM